ncbi:MAG: SLC13 family permease [Parvibaculales bacterium]
MSFQIHMWITFAVILSAMIAFALERLRMEIISLLIIITLMLVFYFLPLEIEGKNLLNAEVFLRGFGNPALISVIALLIMGQGLFHSGALESVSKSLVKLASNHHFLALGFIFLLAIITSMFLNNTPVVVMFIPILSAVALRSKLDASQVMMSLSFLCILGGFTTLIASSTNLLVAGAVATHTEIPPIGFFDFTIPGLFLAGVGSIYVFLIMPFLFPKRDKKNTTETVKKELPYIVGVRLRYGDKLVGIKAEQGKFPGLETADIKLILRDNQKILPPFDDVTLKTGDKLSVLVTRTTLTDALKSSSNPLGEIITRSGKSLLHALDEEEQESFAPTLAEIVVAPGSSMSGRTLNQLAFEFETHCRILGIQRRGRILHEDISIMRLQPGDELLVLGKENHVQELRNNHDVLLLEWSTTELPNFSHAVKARLIFLGTILLAAFSIVPIVIAALCGAAAMLLSNTITPRQAIRAIDIRIFLIIAASIAMASALEITGGAEFLAHSFINVFANAPIPVILSVFFLITALMTNILSNNATALLFTPIAINLSQQLGIDPMAFIFAVLFASNCSFATPFAYQTNLLVMGPGKYQFRDFLRAGLPLVIIIWITYSLFAPYYYGL